jgi:hypothetical protein
MLERDESYGLNLEGSVEKWGLDAETMMTVTAWLKAYKSIKRKTK